MTDFLTAAAAIWHLLVILVVIAGLMIWADRRSDRVWRAQLHGCATAEDLAELQDQLEQRIDQRYRSHAACRRGQDTPAKLSEGELALLRYQPSTDLPFNVTPLDEQRRRRP